MHLISLTLTKTAHRQYQWGAQSSPLMWWTVKMYDPSASGAMTAYTKHSFSGQVTSRRGTQVNAVFYGNRILMTTFIKAQHVHDPLQEFVKLFTPTAMCSIPTQRLYDNRLPSLYDSLFNIIPFTLHSTPWIRLSNYNSEDMTCRGDSGTTQPTKILF